MSFHSQIQTHHKHSKSSCPVIQDLDLLTFLEPSFSPKTLGNNQEPSKTTFHSNKSYDCSKPPSPKTPKTQDYLSVKSSSNANRARLNSSQQFSFTNITNKLKKPEAFYKNHAVQLTKESIIKKYADKSTENIIKDIQEPLGLIKNTLNWIMEQSDNASVKMVKNSVTDTLKLVKVISVEIEARLDVLTNAYEAKIKALQDKASEAIKKIEGQQKELVQSLIEQNLKLSNNLCVNEKEISEKEHLINVLREDNKHSMIFLSSEETAESKGALSNNSSADKEDLFNDIKNIELEFNSMRTKIINLEEEVKSKDIETERYLKQIEILNKKISELEKRSGVRKIVVQRKS